MKAVVVCVLLCMFGSAFAALQANQLSALQDLYNQCSGTSWTSQTNWMTGDPCSSKWEGVTCDTATASTVTVLNLDGFGLVGSIPASLGNLVNLTELRLADNSFPNEIPASVWAITTYEKFFMWKNGHTGTIPEVTAQWVNVVEWEMYENSFTGSIPPGVGNLPALARFAMDVNKLSGTIPQGFAQKSAMTLLNISDNLFTGTVPFLNTTFPIITDFNVSCNCYTSYPEWCFTTICAPCNFGPCNRTNAFIAGSTSAASAVVFSNSFACFAGIVVALFALVF